MTRPFVHLHNHTEHSHGTGMQQLGPMVTEIACHATEIGDPAPAVAVTDHGTLSGTWQFAVEAAAVGVKPILGSELYLAVAADQRSPGDRHDPKVLALPSDPHLPVDLTDPDLRSVGPVHRRRHHHLTVLAESPAGWDNLVRITNETERSYTDRPLADLDLIADHAEGLIVLTGCLAGPVASHAARGDLGAADAQLAALVDRLGRHRVYVEVMDHGLEIHRRIVPDLVRLAGRYGLDVVATNDTHYSSVDHHGVHDAWLCVAASTTVSARDRARLAGTGHHLRRPAEMRALFDDQPGTSGACDTTLEIAERCAASVLPDRRRRRLPRFDPPAGYEPSPAATEAGYRGGAAYLRDQTFDGAHVRYGSPLPADAAARLRYELDRIINEELTDLLLITADAVGWARRNGIRVGPGRGSSAASAVAYCLGISGVDPVAGGLRFERFLGDDRDGVSLPDIDIDFDTRGRDRVYRYLADRWGPDRVARAGTFNVARPRRALRDMARVLGHGDVADILAGAVPADRTQSLSQLTDPDNPAGGALRAAAGRSDRHRAVVDAATVLDGTVAGSSIHPCGVVIADRPLEEILPCRVDRRADTPTAGMWVTQWDGSALDEFGLLTFDALGLRALDVMSACAQMITDTTGETVDPDSPPTSSDDARVARTWAMLGEGHTAGVFQLESTGMTRLITELRPVSIQDLSAALALYRPGPLAVGMGATYVARRHGREPVDYAVFTSEPGEQEVIAGVLDDTFGVPLYQEQLLGLAEQVGGLDSAERSRLRRAVSKKDRAEMAAVGRRFVDGATHSRAEDNGGGPKRAFDRSTAERLWAEMAGAADWTFNAAHSLAYAWLSYCCAFLKANWPGPFAAAVLSSGSRYDRAGLLLALRAEGTVIEGPAVNTAGASTRVDAKGAVTLGLREIKGVGTLGDRIVDERDQRGEFTSLADLAHRVTVNGAPVPIEALEALIESGALDGFGSRLGMTMILRALADHPDVVPAPEEWGVIERAQRERQRLGVICSPHPLVQLGDQLRAWQPPGGAPAVPVHRVAGANGAQVTTVGVVASWDERPYAAGDLARLVLEGSCGTLDAVVWNDTLRSLRSAGAVPATGSVVAVSGRLGHRGIGAGAEERAELNVQALHNLDIDDRAPSAATALVGPAPVPWTDTPAHHERPAGDSGDGSGPLRRIEVPEGCDLRLLMSHEDYTALVRRYDGFVHAAVEIRRRHAGDRVVLTPRSPSRGAGPLELEVVVARTSPLDVNEPDSAAGGPPPAGAGASTAVT